MSSHSIGSDLVDPQLSAADALADKGQLGLAVDAYLAVIASEPKLAQAHYKLGMAYQSQNELTKAEACFWQATQLLPGYPEAGIKLGIILARRGETTDAEILFRNALAEDVDDVEAHLQLGTMLRVGTRRAEALYHLQRATQLDPKSGLAKERLGSLMYDLGLLTEAITVLIEATQLSPGLAAAWINLARCHMALNEFEQADEYSRVAIPLDPHQLAPWHNVLLGLNRNGGSKESVFSEHVGFASHLEDVLGIAPFTDHANSPRPDRRLRIGLVSGDLRRHSVSYFLEGFLTQINRSGFEVWAYYNYHQFDFRSAELKRHITEWRDIHGKPDHVVAKMIRRDGIDILIDLSGHTGGSRLDVFAHKAAPVQASWIGYPNTTGLKTIDYRITDAIADPVGKSEQFHTETLIRLPGCFLNYTPPAEAPAIAPLPCTSEGYVTFGSFNTRAKITDRTLALWARILAAVEQSRLVVKSVSGISDEVGKEQLLGQMQRFDIDPARVVLMAPEASIEDHLASYTRIDIGLDTIPYNGTTTTCEAAWMGVPVVALTGDRHASRVGASLLVAMGLPELVAASEDDYVRIASDLARDRDRLMAMRASMRERLRASPLLDAVSSTRNMEHALRKMWVTYCNNAVAKPDQPRDAEIAQREITVKGAYRVAVAANPLANKSDWALYEQEDGCDDALAFLRKIDTSNWQAIDVGSGQGLFALALVRGGARKVWALEPASVLRLGLRNNITLNNCHAQIEMLPIGLADNHRDRNFRLPSIADSAAPHQTVEESAELFQLDAIAKNFVAANTQIDFVRLNAGDETLATLRGGLRFFLEQSPLLMFTCRQENGALNIETTDTLRAMAYQIYRLVPGIACLIPVAHDEALDGSVRHLFACKSDRARKLAAFVATVLPVREVPLQAEWQETLLSVVVPRSSESIAWSDFGFASDYGQAILAWCGSRQEKLPPRSRYQLLTQALKHAERASNAGDDHPAVAALGIRLCADAGMHTQALAIADAFLEQMSAEDEFPLDRPLPPIYGNFDAKLPIESLGKFMYQSLVEFVLDRRQSSTFLASSLSAHVWAGLVNPERSARFERSLVLWQARAGTPLTLKSNAKLFASAPDNLNASVWREIALEGEWLAVEDSTLWSSPGIITRQQKIPDGALALAQASNLFNSGEAASALSIAQEALLASPSSTGLHNIAAAAARALGRSVEAEQHWRQAIAVDPQYADAHANLGFLLAENGRPTEAEPCYRRALEINPAHADAHNNLAVLLMASDRLAEAEESLNSALAAQAMHVDANNNLGLLHKARGDLAAAERFYRRALSAMPDHARTLNNLGVLLMETQHLDEAEAAYVQALAIDPDYAEAHNNHGLVLLQTKRLNAAETAFKRAVALRPNHASSHMNLGVLMKERGDYGQAESAFRRSMELLPESGNAASEAYHCARHLCDWTHQHEDELRLIEMLRRGISDISPFILLSMANGELETPAAAHKLVAYRYAQESLQLPTIGQLPTRTIASDGRLKIAYLSSDFHEHATMYLLRGVLAAHDKSRFSIYGYSYSIYDDAMTAQARAACDEFRDIRGMSDEAAAKLIAADRIDILVDLKGYTANTRLGICAWRPAPLILSWLGYPGTLGHPRLADFVIGDKVVTPAETSNHYSERIACMPHCYQPNDDDRVVGTRPTRKEVGLPENDLVFCCFNSSYKITRDVFQVWCRLLRDVPQSVLWLLAPSAQAVENLRREATSLGVMADRLIFAPSMPHTEHLGRLQLADIALDSYPYTSHTTASDVLWAGVPLVTKIGETFASRVAASLLKTLGMDELVATNWEDYFQIARKLASSSKALAAKKMKVAELKARSPLFDTRMFTRDLEQLYINLAQQHRVEAANVPSDMQHVGLRLHIGGVEAKAGWKILNALPGPNVDFVGDLRDLSGFANESCAELYASHVLEHISQTDMLGTLLELHRILVPGGRLSISVPDLQVLCEHFLDPHLNRQQRFHVMRMIFGGQIDAYDFHQIGLSLEFLADYLSQAGFSSVEQVDGFSLFDDTSNYAPYGRPISLNIVAIK